MASLPSSDTSGQLEALRVAVRGAAGRPGLSQILPRLQRSHLRDLIRREQWTHGDLARHPEPREVIRSRRRAGNVDPNGRFVRIFDARRVLVEDVHENRLVRHVVRDVKARLSAMEGPEAAQLRKELDGAIARAPFLRNVGDLKARPTEPTPALLADPLYRTIFQSWLELSR
jgi:predicted component of viral defense system (DUF524 family)